MNADVIVLGVGGMGSAALYSLARRGADVVGIEQFGVAHDRGSSHGETRLIRKAYFEAPNYIPLLQAAYAGWRDLAPRTALRIFEDGTGLAVMGPADCAALTGTMAVARAHGLPIKPWTAAEASRRFPRLVVPTGYELLWDADGGILYVENCVRAFIQGALKAGARLRENERVLDLQVQGSHVEVRTDRETLTARHAVVAGGAWTGALLGHLGLPLQVKRKVLFWFRPRDDGYALGSFPPFIYDNGPSFIYGFPDVGTGLKAADHRGGQLISTAVPDRGLLPGDAEPVTQAIRDWFSGVDPEPVSYRVCMYTVTPDEDFILDRVSDRLSVAGGFSGHGFKFAPLVGNVLADLALDGGTAQPVEFLRRDRFTPAK